MQISIYRLAQMTKSDIGDLVRITGFSIDYILKMAVSTHNSAKFLLTTPNLSGEETEYLNHRIYCAETVLKTLGYVPEERRPVTLASIRRKAQSARGV